MAQCLPGTSQVIVSSTDFESNDGGFVESGAGDWEYGVIPVSIDLSSCDSPTLSNSPGGAHSGTKGWGTILDGCYHNLGAFSGVGFTVDLSNPGYTSAELQFAQWYQVFTNFDYIRITANGNEIWINNTVENSNGWLVTQVNLDPYVGQSAVNIVFDLWATTVVNRPGWYIDDVSVTACASGTTSIGEFGMAAFRAWPVPAADLLNVEPSKALGPILSWTLFDATGRVLAEGGRADSERFSVDVSAFHGVAIMELRTTSGAYRQRVLMQ